MDRTEAQRQLDIQATKVLVHEVISQLPLNVQEKINEQCTFVCLYEDHKVSYVKNDSPWTIIITAPGDPQEIAAEVVHMAAHIILGHEPAWHKVPEYEIEAAVLVRSWGQKT